MSKEEQFYVIWPLLLWACAPRGLLRVIALTVLAVVLDDLGNARASYFSGPAKTGFYQHGVALLGGSRLPSVLLLAAVGVSMSYIFGWLRYHLYEKHSYSGIGVECNEELASDVILGQPRGSFSPRGHP